MREDVEDLVPYDGARASQASTLMADSRRCSFAPLLWKAPEFLAGVRASLSAHRRALQPAEAMRSVRPTPTQRFTVLLFARCSHRGSVHAPADLHLTALTNAMASRIPSPWRRRRDAQRRCTHADHRAGLHRREVEAHGRENHRDSMGGPWTRCSRGRAPSADRGEAPSPR